MIGVWREQMPEGMFLESEHEKACGRKRVVIATGLSHAEHMPPELEQLPEELRSHSNIHRDLSQFKGRAQDMRALCHGDPSENGRPKAVANKWAVQLTRNFALYFFVYADMWVFRQ